MRPKAGQIPGGIEWIGRRTTLFAPPLGNPSRTVSEGWSMGNENRIVALELGSWVQPQDSEGYHVMFGRDSLRASYTSGPDGSYVISMDGEDAIRVRESMESLELGSWPVVIGKCQQSDITWNLAVLFDDGEIVECSGTPDSIPEYEVLVETLMGLFGDIEVE